MFLLSQRAQAALRAIGTSHVDSSVAAPSSVLRVVVENLVYPVSLDALCQVTTQPNTDTKNFKHDKHQQVGCLKIKMVECNSVSLDKGRVGLQM